MEAKDILGEWVPRIEERLNGLTLQTSNAPSTLKEAIRYSLLAPGKRIRPVLTVLCAEAVGGNPEHAIDCACAVEMVHVFSLIHDDLPALDNDDLRRGIPTCHKKFGESIAILAGDALFALAFDTMLGCDLEGHQREECAAILAKASGLSGLVGGEAWDILSEGQEISAEMLKTIHLGKTAALLAACCEIGAVVGGANKIQREALRNYGKAIGLAFQITDDVLNEESTSEQLGKAAGSDKALGKATYPALFGLPGSKTMARAHYQEALTALEPLPNPSKLSEIALFTIERLK